MYIPQDLLAMSELSVYAIARRVGYDAEEAFSRTFKRECGVSPGFWRSRYHAQRGVVG
jgi:AraC-like DNA-binding protein